MVAATTAFIRRWYFLFVLVLFVVSPELRRVADYLTSVHKLSPFSVLPLAAMLPAVFFVVRRWKDLGSTYRLVATIWLVAFGVALLIGIASGSLLAAMYDMLAFGLPISFGIILAATSDDLSALYRRVAGSMLVLTTLSSIYAIYQYVAPPQWDVFWVLNSGLISTGVPEPFGLRVFGTLNSYAIFAHFLALTMILNLPRLGRATWRSVIAYIPCSIALLLTSDRTAWLAFAAGLVIYSIIAPRRVVALKSLAIMSTITVVVSGVLLVSLRGSDDVTTLLQQRFASLTDIKEDNSFNDRQLQTKHALRESLSEPLGQGLGDVGTAANAGSSATTNTLDNGYLARFVELGAAGAVAYLVALAIAVFALFRAYRASLRHSADTALPGILAASLAVQVMMLGIDVSTDSHNGLLGLIFWFSIYVGSRYLAELEFAEKESILGLRLRRSRRVLVEE